MAVSVELNILADYSRLDIINTFITFFLPSPVREVHFSCSLPCSFHVWNVTPQLLMAVIRPSRYSVLPSRAVLSINKAKEMMLFIKTSKMREINEAHQLRSGQQGFLAVACSQSLASTVQTFPLYNNA